MQETLPQQPFGQHACAPGAMRALRSECNRPAPGISSQDNSPVSLAIAIPPVIMWLGMMFGALSLLISNKFPAAIDQAIQKVGL